MDLKKFDGKYVRVTDTSGETFTGVADYCGAEFCMHEYGIDENAVIVGKYMIAESQIAAIEEIEMHGTAELRLDRLVLRRYIPDDAEELYRHLGTDPTAYQYSGWNPYATPEMARETVQRFMDSYQDDHFYGWVMDAEDDPVGTIGAYDYHDGQIEVGFSVFGSCRRRGYAGEALEAVIRYLTQNEGIPRVTAWCAAENTGSKKVLEKAGMRLVRTEKDGLTVGDRKYDRLVYEYSMKTEEEGVCGYL